MSQNNVSSEINKNICEAFGCFLEATTKIELRVGQQGIITIDLCKGCVKRFQDNNGAD
jgi:hypothetical protein